MKKFEKIRYKNNADLMLMTNLKQFSVLFVNLKEILGLQICLITINSGILDFRKYKKKHWLIKEIKKMIGMK